MRHPSHRVAIALVAAVTLLGACGDDGASGPDLRPGSNETTTTSSASETTTTTAPESTASTTTGTATGPPKLTERSSVGTTGLDTVVFGMTLAQAEAAAGTRGLDTVVFGMTLAQAEAAAGTRLVASPTFSGGPGCSIVVPESGPPGVFFTLTRGTVERVDVRPPSTIGTRSGARIGTTVAQLQSLYGDRLTAGADGAYVFTPRDAADAAFRVIFATDGSVVTAYRSGRVPQVETADPC